MKYAKKKQIGDFLVTVKPYKDYVLLEISYRDNDVHIPFDADLFWLDGSSHMPDGEAHYQETLKSITPCDKRVQLRSEENHLRINSPAAKGRIEAITWK